jgi:hypothetical protein
VPLRCLFALVCVVVSGRVLQAFDALRRLFELMNRPSSASTEDDMTARIICKMLRMAPLLKGMSSFPAMNMCPPAQLQDFGSDKYDASLWIAKTMSLAW